MPTLDNVLKIDRCPHCNVDTPNLTMRTELRTTDSENQNNRLWRIYACTGCGGVVTAAGHQGGGPCFELFPRIQAVDEAIPERAKYYLRQATQSLHAPAGAVMLAASAVDAMLKAKSYTEGSLYSRINNAATAHLITSEMAEWAHDVRLDANDQRHADSEVHLPSRGDALRCVEFATALGQFLFVLPARVRRGREEAAQGRTA